MSILVLGCVLNCCHFKLDIILTLFSLVYYFLSTNHR